MKIKGKPFCLYMLKYFVQSKRLKICIIYSTDYLLCVISNELQYIFEIPFLSSMKICLNLFTDFLKLLRERVFWIQLFNSSKNL